MAVKKERNELEYLRGELRKLKSENKHLKKCLKTSNKTIHSFEATYEKDDEEPPPPPLLSGGDFRCESCLSQNIDIIELGIKRVFVCKECKTRKISNKKKP